MLRRHRDRVNFDLVTDENVSLKVWNSQGCDFTRLTFDSSFAIFPRIIINREYYFNSIDSEHDTIFLLVPMHRQSARNAVK